MRRLASIFSALALVFTFGVACADPISPEGGCSGGSMGSNNCAVSLSGGSMGSNN